MPKKYKHRKTISIKGKRYNIYAYDLITLGQKISDKIKDVEEKSKTVGSDTLMSDWAAACVNAYKRKLSEKTRRHYMNSIKNHILLEIGHMRIEDVRPIHCQNILNNQEGFSKSHINTIYQQLRFLFKHAVGDRLIVMDPTTNLVKPDGTQGHRRALTPAERELFLRIAVTDRRYYIYLLMMLCGCRPSESYACEGRDLSLSEGYPILHIMGTKTDNADRFVPVPDEFINS